MPTVPGDPLDSAIDNVMGGGKPERETARDPLDIAIDGVMRDQPVAKLRNTAVLASELTPESVADYANLSKVTGLPVAAIMSDPKSAKRDAEFSALDKLQSESPLVAEWMAKKPENFALAKDDAENLSFVEKTLASLGSAAQSGADVGRAAVGGVVQFAGSAISGLAEVPGIQARSAQRASEAFWGLFGEEYAQRVRDNAEIVKPVVDAPRNILGNEGVGGWVEDRAKDIGPPEERQNIATDIANGIGQAGGFITLGALTGGAGVVVAGAGMGIDQQADQAEQVGKYGTAEADAAMALGAVITGVTEKFGLDRILKRVPKSVRERFGKRVADILLNGAAAEGAQEISEQALHNAVAMATYDQSQELFEGVAEAGGIGAAVGGLIRMAVHARSGRVRGKSENEQVDTLSKLVQKSELFRRWPEKMDDLLESLPESRRTVYMPAEQVNVLFQSAPEAVQAFEAAGISRESISESLALGSDVAVPLPGYLTKIAPEYHAKLGKAARMSPDTVTDADIDANEEQDAAVERFLASVQEHVPEGEADLRVYNDVLGQLIGTYSQTDAEKMADLANRVFRDGFLSVPGVDPMAMYQRYGVRIVDELRKRADHNARIDTTLDPLIDRLRAGDRPRGTRRQTLADFIADTGGVRDDALAGELRSLHESDRVTRRGKAPLYRKDAERDLDRAREAAAEAGYLPMDSDINDLLSLLDNEMSGKPTYAMGDEADSADDRTLAAMDSLDEELSRKGIDVQTATNAEIKKALFGESGTDMPDWLGDVFDQPAYHGTPHTVDRFSLQKIGTGEGAQAFGWGLYFASQKAIAEGYRKALSQSDTFQPKESNPVSDQVAFYLSKGYSLADAKDAAERSLVQEHSRLLTYAGYQADEQEAQLQKRIHAIEASLDLFDTIGADDFTRLKSGNTYQVEVPEDSDLLEYDKSLSEQPEKVREALRNARADLNDRGVILQNADGGSSIYNLLSAKLGSPRAAAEYLRSIGIPGLRYLDGNSRGAGDGSHNYVIWDENAISEPTALYQSAFENNGSGESSASIEAIGRLRDERAAGQYRMLIDRDGSVRPLFGVDAVDTNARDGQVIVQRGIGRDEWTVLSHGYDLSRDRVEGILNRSRDALASEAEDAATLYQSAPSDARGATGVAAADAFRGMTREQFLGDPKITSNANGADLKPKVLTTTASADQVPFKGELTARYNEDGAAVYDGDKVIASYNHGDVLVVDKKYRRQGIAEELVYQWRVRNPEAKPAKHRTKASQAIQEKVWARIQRELRSTELNQSNRRAEATRRGYIDITDRSNIVIGLTRAKNLSTFVHEFGHLGLEVMSDLAAEHPHIAAEWGRVVEWWSANAEAISTQPELDADVRQKIAEAGGAEFIRKVAADFKGNHGPATKAAVAALHEYWARGFEKYLGTGKAPTPELNGAFVRFKAWMLRIYKSLENLNVNLDDNIRGVFDRMLAGNEAVSQADDAAISEPMFKEAARAGWSEARFQAYLELRKRASEDAEAAMHAHAVKEVERETAKWWKAESAVVEQEVRAELYAEPVYRAWHALARNQLPDGTPLDTPPIKLDKDALLGMVDGSQAWLNENLRFKNVYALEGGLHPELVAELFGFPSGREMVEALANAAPLNKAVKAETEARMRERYGDMRVDGTIAEKAMKAVHNGKRFKVLVAEAEALAEMTGEPALTLKQARDYAKRQIAAKRVRDLVPYVYLRAERKAAREALRAAAAGNNVEALAAARRRLVSAVMYDEAVRAQEDLEKARKTLAKFQTKKVRAKLGKAGGGYLDQIDALLERFDFRRVSGPDAARRESLASWIAAQEAAGRPVNIPAKLRDEAFRAPFDDLTTADAKSLRDTVKHIAHLADFKNKLLLAKEVRDAKKVDAEIGAAVLDNNKLRAVDGPHVGTLDNARVLALQVRGIQGAPADLAQELDGFKELGAVYRHVVLPVHEAINNEVRPREDKAKDDLANIYLRHYSKKELRGLWDAEPIKAVGGAKWTKGQILILALHRGNAGNVEAILQQRKWKLTMPQIDALLSRLDSRDWAFVQETAAYINAYWGEASEATKRRTGLTPKKIEGTPFTVKTADGKVLNLPGWYFHLAYEADGEVSQSKEMQQAYEQLMAGRNPMVDVTSGSQIERVGSGGRTVRFDLGVIESHLSDVIRGTHLADAINYSHRVMHGKEFVKAINATGNQEHLKALKLWLKDAATGELVLRNKWEQTARAVRTNFTAAVLTWKLSTALLQYTGIASTWAELGAGWTRRGLTSFLSRPKLMREYVHSASPMMARRANHITDSVEQLQGAKVSLARALRSANMKYGMWLIGRTQSHIDMITWLGAEAKGLKLFDGDAGKARAFADDIVTRTQGTQEFAAKNALLRGTVSENTRQTELVRGLMALQGYMLAKGNMAYRATVKAKFGDMRLDAASAERAYQWGGSMVLLFTIDAILGSLARGQWPDDEDDDGSKLDDWALFLGKQTGFSILGAFPGGSSLVSGVRGYDQQGVLSAAWSSVGDVIEQANQGEVDKAAIKATVTAAGYATGLPSSQINKTIDAIDKRNNGGEVSPYEYINGPPKK